MREGGLEIRGGTVHAEGIATASGSLSVLKAQPGGQYGRHRVRVEGRLGDKDTSKD